MKFEIHYKGLEDRIFMKEVSGGTSELAKELFLINARSVK